MLKLTYLFCIYSVLGWIIEIIFFFVKTKQVQKRGILQGAYCPLYGFSMAVNTAILRNSNNLFMQFIICGLICVLFELITGILFDVVLNHKMWDYTGMRGNIGGYICIQFGIIWGILGVFAINVVNPLLFSINNVIITIVTIGICILIATDFFISVIKRKRPDA